MNTALRGVRIGAGSRVMDSVVLYEPTYLIGNEATLFLVHVALVRTKSGKESYRTRSSVLTYPDEAAWLGLNDQSHGSTNPRRRG